MMKKVLVFLMVTALGAGLYSCSQRNAGERHIVGTVNGEQYEGKRIFLVPLYGPTTAEYVDSIEIKDGKFEFSPDVQDSARLSLSIRIAASVGGW